MTARAWILFALSSIIWGVPYLFIKIAVDHGLSPAFVAWARTALAAILLAPLAWRRGAFQGLRAHAPAIGAYTFCEIAAPFLLIAIGERYITSSLTAILVSTMPLMVTLLSLRTSSSDRPDRTRILGLLIGFLGVVAMLGIDVAGKPAELLGTALVLLATLGYATAPVIVSRYLADLDPLGPVSASLIAASLVLLPAAVAMPPKGIPDGAALVSLLVLGTVCTALGLVVFFHLIAEAGPNRASVITYVNPVIALIAGAVTLGERIGAASAVGLALILVGSWLSTRGRPREGAPPRRRS